MFEKEKPLNGRCDTFKLSHRRGSPHKSGILCQLPPFFNRDMQPLTRLSDEEQLFQSPCITSATPGFSTHHVPGQIVSNARRLFTSK